jgi:hypothetical protein
MNIVALNAFTIQDFLLTKEGLAVGLFHPINYFNHNCQPNCVQIFDGRFMNVISNKNI